MGLANVVICIDYRGTCLPDSISNISTEMNTIIHPSQSIAQVEKERSDCISKCNIAALPTDTYFLATDVSEELALQATQLALKTKSNTILNPLIFDLATADNLPEFLDLYVGPNRIYTFFGIIPNFPPKNILPQLRALLRPGDYLLLSANLNPTGMETILPQYNNQLTRKWLAEFPRNHGAGKGDVRVTIKSDNCLKYISASFLFLEPCVMEANGDSFKFNSGDSLQLFVSYRYTVKSLTKTLRTHGIQTKTSFISKNGEEGVFICSL